MAAGVDIRHRKHCTSPRDDGKCCGAGWQAYVFDKRAGKLIRTTFPNKTAAKQWRQDALVALRRGEFPSTGHSRTVAAAMSELLAGMSDGTVLDRSGPRYRPATVRSYRQAWRGYLEPSLGRLRLSEVRRSDVQRIIDRMHADGKSGSTIRNKLDPLRVLYRRALEDEQVTRNPTSHLRLPENKHQPRRVVNVDRADALLDALPDIERALWATAVFAGLRIGELRALRWTAVQFERRRHPRAGRVGRPGGRAGNQDGRGSADGPARRTAPRGARAAQARDRPQRQRPRVRPNRHGSVHPLDGPGAPSGHGRPPSSSRSRRTRCATPPRATWPPPACRRRRRQTALGHADIRTTLNVYATAVPGWETEAAAKLDAYRGAKVLRKSSTQPSGS
jgi:integrase